MLETTLKIITESNHPETTKALREIAVFQVAMKYMAYEIRGKKFSRAKKSIEDIPTGMIDELIREALKL